MKGDLPDFYSDALFRVLLQRAVTERRVTMSNNGPTPSGPFPFNVLKGKFFSRGMRGFVEAVELYLKGADVDVTITISFRVYPEGGEIFRVEYTLPAGEAEGWKTVTVRRPWLYDSMFLVCDSADRTSPVHYEDYGTPYDAYAADPAAPQEFEPWNIRFWWRVVVTALTPGDVPVSGTLNTIQIPGLSSTSRYAITELGAGASVDMFTIEGIGETINIILMAEHDVEIRFFINVDGVNIDFDNLDYFTAYRLNFRGYSATTPNIQLLKYTSGGQCWIQITMPIPFKRKLVITAENTGAVGYDISGSILAKVLT